MLSAIRKYLRQCFLTGILTLIPLISTIWIIKTIVVWAQDFFLGLVPYSFHPQKLLGYDIPGVGLVVTVLLIFLVGLIMRTYLATRIVLLGEAVLSRIPIARGVYPGIKRLMQLMVGDQSDKSARVVLAPYPHPNSRAYGFATGSVTIPNAQGEPVSHLRVFVPTTPNPTSGFLLMIPESDVIFTDLSIDQASKLIVSGGLV